MATISDPAAYLAEHYIYEINMLRETHRLLPFASNRALANALIESFCVHARSLLDFYRSKPLNDDVVATDFISSQRFDAAATSRLPADMRIRMNKQIAHLTASRENATKINVTDRQALLNAIEADHAAFKKEVDPRYADCFSREVPYESDDISALSVTNSVQFATTDR